MEPCRGSTRRHAHGVNPGGRPRRRFRLSPRSCPQNDAKNLIQNKMKAIRALRQRRRGVFRSGCRSAICSAANGKDVSKHPLERFAILPGRCPGFPLLYHCCSLCLAQLVSVKSGQPHRVDHRPQLKSILLKIRALGPTRKNKPLLSGRTQLGLLASLKSARVNKFRCQRVTQLFLHSEFHSLVENSVKFPETT